MLDNYRATVALNRRTKKLSVKGYFISEFNNVVRSLQDLELDNMTDDTHLAEVRTDERISRLVLNL